MKTTELNKELIARLEAHIASECSAVDLDERYDQMLESCYPETVNVCGMEMDALHVYKTMGPTAYNCGRNDWLDGECGETLTQEINGKHYPMPELAFYE